MIFVFFFFGYMEVRALCRELEVDPQLVDKLLQEGVTSVKMLASLSPTDLVASVPGLRPLAATALVNAARERKTRKEQSSLSASMPSIPLRLGEIRQSSVSPSPSSSSPSSPEAGMVSPKALRLLGGESRTAASSKAAKVLGVTGEGALPSPSPSHDSSSLLSSSSGTVTRVARTKRSGAAGNTSSGFFESPSSPASPSSTLGSPRGGGKANGGSGASSPSSAAPTNGDALLIRARNPLFSQVHLLATSSGFCDSVKLKLELAVYSRPERSAAHLLLLRRVGAVGRELAGLKSLLSSMEWATNNRAEAAEVASALMSAFDVSATEFAQAYDDYFKTPSADGAWFGLRRLQDFGCAFFSQLMLAMPTSKRGHDATRAVARLKLYQCRLVGVSGCR